MNIKLLTEHHLEFLRLKGGFSGSPESIHVKLLEISCHGSYLHNSTSEYSIYPLTVGEGVGRGNTRVIALLIIHAITRPSMQLGAVVTNDT